jgi:hypothetical protein
MRKIISVACVLLLFAACKDANNTTTSSAKDTTTYPYKAGYSSSFDATPNPANIKACLQSYKDWEDNKLANAPAYFADSVHIEFAGGDKFDLGRDSMVKMFQKFRDSLVSSKIVMDAFSSMHSIDRNEDWVCVWYKQYDTYKSGKVDSAYYEDENRMKNGKINLYDSKKKLLAKK